MRAETIRLAVGMVFSLDEERAQPVHGDSKIYGVSLNLMPSWAVVAQHEERLNAVHASLHS